MPKIVQVVILSMAEILHHLGCKNPTNDGRSYPSTGAGFQPSTVVFHSITFFNTFSGLAIHPTGRFCGDKDGQFAACPDPNAKPAKNGTLAVGLAMDFKQILGF